MPTKKTDSQKKHPKKSSVLASAPLSPPDKKDTPDIKVEDTKKTDINPADTQETDTKIGFPIVGIGASAGGLAAIEAFFSGMPPDIDPNMAFVLVQHLAPDHKSILTDLIQRYTRMKVYEVTDGMVIRPNCAYIIPPNRDMAALNRTLQLLKPSAPRGQRLPIDFLFRSLARDQGRRAICIILSGTGSDGTLGLRAIKGEGGMAMAQTPDSTEYDGMPRSALATGLVDYELPPRKMPSQLIAYVAQALGSVARPAILPSHKVENVLQKIFILLRTHTGHDFSQYKPNTLLRRIQRRMAVHQIENMLDYVRFLQQTPVEVEALFRDLLIGVTNFFRDPEAFKALEEQVLPQIFSNKPEGGVIRIWTPGCSTGEEAYSLAILLAQYQHSLKHHFKIQVFATDIDSQAIVSARAGLYPSSIADDVPPEILEHYFAPEFEGTFFRIHKTIRDMLVFSEQDVIKDPPFSKLDIISCRNLLIYMNAVLQKKLIPLFHYALNPKGFLFLGTSETVGEYNDLFTNLNRKMKLYQRRENGRNTQRLAQQGFLIPMPARHMGLPDMGYKRPSARPPLREITEQALLVHMSPVAVLVDAQGNILYLHGRTGMFLELAPGESDTNNILKMAREGLQRGLSLALHKAVAKKTREFRPGLRVKTNGAYTLVDTTVFPLAPGLSPPGEAPFFLVILAEAPFVPSPRDSLSADLKKNTSPDTPAGDLQKQIAGLENDLRAKEEYLQTTIEELETTNEELKSSNEEMQSMNEELQSTNEELETSKEELQSVNEELSTVNAELQTKVADLMQVNNDMNNLLAGTGIATVFVDHDLCIMRFTPTATDIINLIPSDVGRPVAHVVSNLIDYDQLVKDAQSVLDTLIHKEVEVETKKGRYFTLRIQPYRTLNNVIEGAVITFVDITKAKKAEAALLKSTSPPEISPDKADSPGSRREKDTTDTLKDTGGPHDK